MGGKQLKIKSYKLTSKKQPGIIQMLFYVDRVSCEDVLGGVELGEDGELCLAGVGDCAQEFVSFE